MKESFKADKTTHQRFSESKSNIKIEVDLKRKIID